MTHEHIGLKLGLLDCGYIGQCVGTSMRAKKILVPDKTFRHVAAHVTSPEFADPSCRLIFKKDTPCFRRAAPRDSRVSFVNREPNTSFNDHDHRGVKTGPGFTLFTSKNTVSRNIPDVILSQVPVTDVGNQPNRARSTRPPPPPLKSASIPTASTGTPSASSLSRCRSVAPGTSRGEMRPL